jgi:lipoyl-dependent peroxiredoxin
LLADTGYAACIHNALKRVARHRNARLRDLPVTAEVSIGPIGSGGFGWR